MSESSNKVTGSIGTIVGDLGFNLSEYNNLNYPWLFNNPFMTYGDPFEHAHELGRSVKVFNLLTKVAEKSLSKNIIPPSGPFIGVVLKFDSFEPAFSQGGEVSELDRILDGTMDQPSTKFVMRVRIDALHAHLPLPKTVIVPAYEKSNFENLSDQALPCQQREKIDNDIVDLYPQIVGTVREGEASLAPQVGSLVYVDFASVLFQAGGYYVGPVTDKVTVTTKKIYGTASSSFKKEVESPEEKKIAVQPSGQFDTPEVSEDSQVAKPKPIEKPKNASTQVPLG